MTLLTAFFILAAAPMVSQAGDADPVTLAIGRPAPDFCLPGVDGNDHRLKDFDDAKVLVVVFTCNHCPSAQAYEDRIKQLAEDYENHGVAVVAISPNDPRAVRLDELGYTDVGDSFEDMKLRAKHAGFNFPYLYDGDDQQVSRAYGPVATPHAFVFDAQRRLRYVGRIDNSARIDQVTSHDVRAALDAILEGSPVPVASTPTFGCSVKWSDKRSSVGSALERWAGEEVSIEPIDPAGAKSLVENGSGKLRLINIWATWCGPCRTEFPELVAIHRMYRKRDFELITISADPPEQEAAALSFLTEQQASTSNYRFVGKNEYELADALDAEWNGALPYTLVVAPSGEVLYRRQGEVDPLELKRAIVARLGRVYQ